MKQNLTKETVFEDRPSGTYACWFTPFGKQELNLSSREIFVDGAKVKVKFLEAPVTRIISKDFTFSFMGKVFNLSQDEIKQVQNLLPVAKSNREENKLKARQLKEQRRKAHEEYFHSEERKEHLIKTLQRVRYQEADVIRQLHTLGVSDDDISKIKGTI